METQYQSCLTSFSELGILSLFPLSYNENKLSVKLLKFYLYLSNLWHFRSIYYKNRSIKRCQSFLSSRSLFNPLQPGVAFLYPWKHQKTLKFVFRGYKKATPGCNGLNKHNIRNSRTRSEICFRIKRKKPERHQLCVHVNSRRS